MALNLPVCLSEAKEKDSVFILELYQVYLKTGTVYFTACDQDITYGGQVYSAVPVTREAITATTDNLVDGCKLTVSNVTDIFTMSLFSGVDFRGCGCVIIQALYPNCLTDNTAVKNVLYGYLDAPILNSKEGTFGVEIKAQMPNLENYRSFKLSCNAEFGDNDSCMASKDINTGVVRSGTTEYSIVIEQTRDNNYWENGIITCGAESRMISSSTGNTIEVRYPFMVTPTSTYTIERGCDKSWENCGLIGQQENFSGFISIPYELVIRTT